MLGVYFRTQRLPIKLEALMFSRVRFPGWLLRVHRSTGEFDSNGFCYHPSAALFKFDQTHPHCTPHEIRCVMDFQFSH